VVGLCLTLLEFEPENLYGFIYLARSASQTGDYPNLVRAGNALTLRSPRDAFNAARKLNQVGRTLEAAQIYAELDIRPDWFDEKVADLAWDEGISLLNAGKAAMDRGQGEAAKIIWTAGFQIAPRSELLRDQVRQLALEARRAALRGNLSTDPVAYVKAWREVLWFNPADVFALTKIARACERENEADAVEAWLNLLAIDPDDETANERVRKLVDRNDLEDHAIRSLAKMGRDENVDPLIREFAEKRDSKARTALAKVMKYRRREAVSHARTVDGVATPRDHLEAWKNVLVLNPDDLGAARKVIGSAKRLGDNSELVEGLIAHLEITPGDAALAQRLASAALRCGREERALEYLARHGMADLAVRQIGGLKKRVLQACKNAFKASDFDHALRCFHALELTDAADPALEALRPALAKKIASSAKAAEQQGNLGVAVPLAEKVLHIVPDQPTALPIVARDLWRQKRYGELVEFCQSKVKSGPEYASVRKLLDQALRKVAA
jgi:tetratricopeptide (TPR) repeat protein